MVSQRYIGLGLRIDQPLPRFQEVLGGIQAYAARRPHWRCVIDPFLINIEPAGEPAGVAYDGVIARASVPMAQAMRQANIPFVNTLFGTASASTAGVYTDTVECGRIVSDHFHERGFRRLAYLGPPDEKQLVAIQAGFIAAAKDRGQTVATEIVNDYFDRTTHEQYWRELTAQLDRFLDRLDPPIGLFVAKAWVGRFLIELCTQRGWSVPQHVAIICAENVKNVVELPPQMTCLAIDYHRVGYEAAALLERLIEGEPAAGRNVQVPPAGIIVRESTDYFAVEDEVVAEALQFMAGRLRERLNVERIANEVAVSPSTLQRRFAAALGHGVGDEVRRLRLELAKRLLHDKHKQINQVAREAGFGSRVAMNYIFNRELGLSPTAYRRRELG